MARKSKALYFDYEAITMQIIHVSHFYSTIDYFLGLVLEIHCHCITDALGGVPVSVGVLRV